MANFQGSVLGALLTLLGWDGSAFRNIKTDSDGHLQVDALTAQLITGFATETTLGTVKDRIGALTTPAAGSTNKLLTDMLTALQLIDDVRGALDSVDTDELVVNVDESVLPEGAATETSLQGIEDNVPDQLIGYRNVYRDRIIVANAPEGDNTLNANEVIADRLHIVTSIMMYDRDSAIAKCSLSVYNGSNTYELMHAPSLAADTALVWTGRVILKVGEYIRGYMEGVILNDNIYLYVHGWQAST